MNVAFDADFIIECCIKVAASVFCGFVLGLERRTRNQVVGDRTLILISVSSTLLSILSYFMAEQGDRRGFTGGDPTRIVAGVVSGIGFLGGGAIMRQGLNIKGLTSATIIWTSSALGLAIGAGLYVQSAVVLVVVMITVVLLEKIEGRWFPSRWNKTIHIMFSGGEVNEESVRQVIEKQGIVVTDLNISRLIDRHQTVLRFSVKTSKQEDYRKLAESLKVLGNLCELTITD